MNCFLDVALRPMKSIIVVCELPQRRIVMLQRELQALPITKVV
jgi:hypothetical protein